MIGSPILSAILAVSAKKIPAVILIVSLPLVPFGLYAWWVLKRYGVNMGRQAMATGDSEATPFLVLKLVALVVTGAALLVVLVTFLFLYFVD